MQHQGECATTDDAATGAEVRPVRASGVAVMVVSTTRAMLGMQQHHAVSKVKYSR